MYEMTDSTNADNILVTPICPVCRINYSEKVRPVILQPCGHGMCKACLTSLKEYACDITNEGDTVRDRLMPVCPVCRTSISADTPNYDLREITSNVHMDHLKGYWEKQIVNLCELKGIKITFSDRIRPYAKPICMRIVYNDTFVTMTGSPDLWSNEEKAAIMLMKNAFVKCVSTVDDSIDNVCKWIGVLAFTKQVERYFLTFFLEWYEHREFLEELDGKWIMDIITHPV